jgi:hypothetical protein
VRELSDETIGHQVDALQSYVARGGSAAVWLVTRDYAPADLAAIEAELQRRQATVPRSA